MKHYILAAALLLASPALAATPCPNSGLRTAKVVFETAKGRFPYQVEVAATVEQQACGMMFRETMKPGTGMSFPMQPPRETGFWMENTILPLDIIFVSPQGRVLNVRQGRPYSRDVLTSAGITADVIELAAGEAKRIGLKAGDRVRR
ncbi:DUF192 domain-containing protein [Sandarakinorhabdus sp.]|uniref:DUF192 domain-containing protein n=1 Tax=Sandarakinorhabdus sp. TaxID=1916663 RepID=UPI003F70AAAC